MKSKTLFLLIVTAFMATSIGCSSGPIGRFFRGDSCNTCMPRTGLFNWRGNSAGLCDGTNCTGTHGAPVTGEYYGPAGGEGYGVDPFGSSAPVFAPVNPPNSGRLPGPTGQ